MLDRVQGDSNAALKAGDRKTVAALRLLFSALKNVKIDNGGVLSDEQATACIKKEIKKRVEARDLYSQNDREELAAQEEFERSIYSQYVPEEMSQEVIDEIIEIAAKEIDEVKFATLMQAVMKQAKGQADGRLVSERVKLFIEKTEKN